jgi:hypothetical protein
MTNLRARLAEVLADIKPWSCGITIADLLTDPALARALEDAEKVPALIRALQEICLRADCQSFSMGTDITAIAKKAIDTARKRHD